MQKVVGLALVMLGGVAAADRVMEPPAAGAPLMHQSRPLPVRQPPPVPHPAPEIAQLGKQLAGHYTCKGVTLNGDGSSNPLAATVTVKLALDDAWIGVSFAESKTIGFKFDDFRTYDATAKQWTRVQLANTSAHVISTSLGEKTGTWTWEGTETSSVGTKAVRDYEQVTGNQLKLWGEAMLSGSWQKIYEATCKR